MEVFIEAIKYLLLGLVQGVTEVLPVSSSGHVEIAQAFFNIQKEEGVLFLILVNTGSFLTFLIIYWKRLMVLIRDFFVHIYNYLLKKEIKLDTKKNFQYMALVILGCIPAGIVGLFLSEFIDNVLLAQFGTLFVGIGFLISGTVLYFIRNVKVNEGRDEISVSDAMFIGVAQAVAIFPGVSRSGMTSSSGIKKGVGIEAALNFSFIMYIPLSFASILLYVYRLATDGVGDFETIYLLYYGLAFVGAIVATYFAYKLIFSVFKSGKLRYFSYYLFIIGVISILFYVLR